VAPLIKLDIVQATRAGGRASESLGIQTTSLDAEEEPWLECNFGWPALGVPVRSCAGASVVFLLVGEEAEWQKREKEKKKSACWQ